MFYTTTYTFRPISYCCSCTWAVCKNSQSQRAIGPERFELSRSSFSVSYVACLTNGVPNGTYDVSFRFFFFCFPVKNQPALRTGARSIYVVLQVHAKHRSVFTLQMYWYWYTTVSIHSSASPGYPLKACRSHDQSNQLLQVKHM